MCKKEKQKNIKGITLIALVITIIVLLILAGVSIAMLTGDNGILTQARNAKEKTEKASELEGIQLAVIGSETKDNEYLDILDEESFQKELEKHFGSEKLDVVANGDGSFIITINDRKYYVNDDKTVIDSDNVIEIGQDDFEKFRDDVNNGNSYEGKAVLLTSDITLSSNWTPIGAYSEETEDNHYLDVPVNKPFKGIFDACNHNIDNLRIDTTKGYQGLFGLVIDGSIRNITVGKTSNSIVKAGTRSGAIIGCLYGFSGNVYNCVNYANVNAAGGVVGLLVGQHTISNCKNYGSIAGAGGIVGGSNGTDWPDEFKNYSCEIINCGNYGNVTRESSGYAGGIIGYFKGSIINCCNKGNISSNDEAVGGITGNIDGAVQNCYNRGDVTSSKWNVGGIVGLTGESLGTQIIDSYSNGNISGTTYMNSIGDIIGDHHQNSKEKDRIINCFGKDDKFTAEDLGEAFKEDKEGEESINNGYPILYWE